MKLSQFAALVTIADTGSFTAAARVLNVSQSAVSHAIAGLETELGVALMRRDRGGVEFTDAGLRILGHARVVVLHVEQMRQEADSLRQGQGGTLRIGTSESFAARLLPRLMTDFHAEYPQFTIALQEGSDSQIAHWLRSHVIDVGIVALPKKELTTVPLLQDEFCAVLPRGHRLMSGVSLSLRQLAEEPIIMPMGGVESVVGQLFRTAGLEPAVSHRVRDLNVLLAMVAEGHGVTVVPALALPPNTPELCVLPLSPVAMRHLAIGVRMGARNSPPVEAFISLALELARRGEWVRPLAASGPAPGAGPDDGPTA